MRYFEDYPDIDSVAAMLDKVAPDSSGTSSHSEGDDYNWSLGMEWEESVECYYGGWSEGAKRAYELSETLKPKPIGNRTTFKRSVAGAFPNVGAYLAGRPDSMWAPTKKTAQGRPFVHLYMPICYYSGIKADTAFDRGCALVAMADALEESGCRVAITLVDSCDMPNQTRYVARYEVKGYSGRLDIDNLIFVAAHPGFFRRICFRAREVSENTNVRKSTNGGYGHGDFSVQDGDMHQDEQSSSVVVVRFGNLTRNGGTPESFLREFVSQLPEELQTDITGG